jgi:hypothetical protein
VPGAPPVSVAQQLSVAPQAPTVQQQPLSQPQMPQPQPPISQPQMPQPPAAVAAWHGSPAADTNGSWYYPTQMPADGQNGTGALNGDITADFAGSTLANGYVAGPQDGYAQPADGTAQYAPPQYAPPQYAPQYTPPQSAQAFEAAQAFQAAQPLQSPQLPPHALQSPQPMQTPQSAASVTATAPAAPLESLTQPTQPVQPTQPQFVQVADPAQAPQSLAQPQPVPSAAPAAPVQFAPSSFAGPAPVEPLPAAPLTSLPSPEPMPSAPTLPSPAAQPSQGPLPSALSKLTGAVRGRRAARKPRLAMSASFADLVDMANIPRSAYAVDEEVTGAMCLFKTDGGYEVFSCAEDARHEVRFFEDEEAAYFYLFGVLTAEALRNGRLSPRRS